MTLRKALGFLVGASALVAIVTLFVQGPRGAYPPILAPRVPGPIYDTRYEETLARGAPRIFEEAFAEYVDVLAEPVAVIEAEGDATVWEVFYATNRAPKVDPSGQTRHGRQVLDRPLVGRSEVRIPARRRGQDPNREQVGAVPKTDAARLEDVRDVDWDKFAQGVARQVNESRQKDLLLFVHGFNVDFESCLIRAAQVSLDMPFNGAVVAYSWPSQGGLTNYRVDEPIAAKSSAAFAEFLQDLLDILPEGTRVNLLAHSMGNRVAMPAIGRLRVDDEDSKPLENVVLCAADVGLRDFRKWAPGVVACARRTTLYASDSDAALIVSKSIHDEARAGDAHPPLVVPGVETIDCSAVDFDFLGHSYYGSNIDVLQDLFRVVKQGRSPNTCRYLSRSNGPDEDCWRFTGWTNTIGWNWRLEDRRRR